MGGGKEELQQTTDISPKISDFIVLSLDELNETGVGLIQTVHHRLQLVGDGGYHRTRTAPRFHVGRDGSCRRFWPRRLSDRRRRSLLVFHRMHSLVRGEYALRRRLKLASIAGEAFGRLRRPFRFIHMAGFHVSDEAIGGELLAAVDARDHRRFLRRVLLLSMGEQSAERRRREVASFAGVRLFRRRRQRQ